MELIVSFDGPPPEWSAVRERLAGDGIAVQTRMIDGQLAFPDEEPPPSWAELRVAAGGGMVTLRRDGNRVTCVVWGNADEPLRRLWHALARGFAESGGGRVTGSDSPPA